jgi:Zn-dependent peptidase ImmA (M78 family)
MKKLLKKLGIKIIYFDEMFTSDNRPIWGYTYKEEPKNIYLSKACPKDLIEHTLMHELCHIMQNILELPASEKQADAMAQLLLGKKKKFIIA